MSHRKSSAEPESLRKAVSPSAVSGLPGASGAGRLGCQLPPQCPWPCGAVRRCSVRACPACRCFSRSGWSKRR
eukprot:scaffold104094_cov45-Prasinocladus_malaysianus.AAC.1